MNKADTCGKILVYTTLRATLFLLFIVKEQTKMAIFLGSLNSKQPPQNNKTKTKQNRKRRLGSHGPTNVSPWPQILGSRVRYTLESICLWELFPLSFLLLLPVKINFNVCYNSENGIFDFLLWSLSFSCTQPILISFGCYWHPCSGCRKGEENPRSRTNTNNCINDDRPR